MLAIMIKRCKFQCSSTALGVGRGVTYSTIVSDNTGICLALALKLQLPLPRRLLQNSSCYGFNSLDYHGDACHIRAMVLDY